MFSARRFEYMATDWGPRKRSGKKEAWTTYWPGAVNPM